MENDLVIEVGIKTQGPPRLEKSSGFTILKNMLIGDGFHWQKVIEAKLPGEIIPVDTQPQASFQGQIDSNISLINKLPLETYLECVAASEMNPDAPAEFLKAHAVISRSWVAGKIIDIHLKNREGAEDSQNRLIGWDDTDSHKGFHVCSDDHCQRYQGIQDIPQQTLNAIRQTAGEVLLSPGGGILDARFSKCCGGVTEIFSTSWQDTEVPGLECFKDPWCDLSGLSDLERSRLLSSILKDYDKTTSGYGFRWVDEISKKEIKSNLKEKFGRDIGDVQSLEPLHRGPSGRIDLLRIHGSAGYLDLGKELWIRRLLSPSHLYSSAFEIEDCGPKIILRGRGWGHGVGLCQIGAANMAHNGHTYRQILSFYYPGSRLSKL